MRNDFGFKMNKHLLETMLFVDGRDRHEFAFAGQLSVTCGYHETIESLYINRETKSTKLKLEDQHPSSNVVVENH
jgi:hypothetical protein